LSERVALFLWEYAPRASLGRYDKGKAVTSAGVAEKMKENFVFLLDFSVTIYYN
jgi:hypothetical protein